MNGSLVTASTAGTESSAKTMSVVSTMISATRSGVATSRAPRSAWRAQKRLPWYCGVMGIMRATQVLHIAHAAATSSRCFCPPHSSRIAAKIMSAAKGYTTQRKRFSRKSPAAMSSARMTSAPTTPQEHSPLLSRWNSQLGKNQQEDEDVVDRERLLQQVGRR